MSPQTPVIAVSGLSKHYKVTSREAGLKAATKSLFKRNFNTVKAVDEITLGIVPVLVGSGRPTFPSEFPETALELVECMQYKGGVVALTYRIVADMPASKKRKRRK